MASLIRILVLFVLNIVFEVSLVSLVLLVSLIICLFNDCIISANNNIAHPWHTYWIYSAVKDFALFFDKIEE